MATIVTVTRRHLRRNYFEAGGGYQGALPSTPGGGGSSRHWEVGRIELVTGDSHAPFHFFSKPFAGKPIGLNNFKVYRMFELATNKWVFQDVLYHFLIEDAITEFGFIINIDALEDINGVIIEFSFTG